MAPMIKKVNLTACIGFVLITTVVAQDDDGQGLSLEALFDIEITIASKTEETVADAPSSVSVFTKHEIENMGVRTVRELLNYVPGFQSIPYQVDGRTHSIQARGRNRGALSNDVLILIDGKRINDAHSGGASLFSRFMTLDNVKQVEIIRGPGSALYGSNAFLGVVNIVTDTTSNDVRVGAGEYGMREVNLRLSNELGSMRYSIYGGYYSDHGDIFDLTPEISPNEKQTRDPIVGNDLYFSLENERLDIRARYQERSLEEFFNFGVVADDINKNKTWESSINFGYKIINSDSLKLRASLYYIRHRWRALTDFGALFIGPLYTNTDGQVALDLDYRISERHHIIAGVIGRRASNDDLDALQGFNLDDPEDLIVAEDFILNAQRERDIVGAYIQDKITLNEYFTFFVGARFDNYKESDRSYSSFNPRGGLIYTSSFDAKFKILYGSAFRAPSLTELYNDSPTTRSNSNLQPEEVETLEIAYIQDFAYGRFTATFFNNDIDSAIQFVQIGDGLSQSENAGALEIQGAEIEYSFALTPELFLKGSYTSIIDSEKSIIGQIGKEPGSDDTYENYGSLILNYSRDDWNLNFNTIYRGEVEELPQQSSYFLANAKVRYHIRDNISIDLAGRNIFDKEYATFEATFPGLAVPNRGRQLSVAVKVTY